jgi:hypothetical protein
MPAPAKEGLPRGELRKPYRLPPPVDQGPSSRGLAWSTQVHGEPPSTMSDFQFKAARMLCRTREQG